MKLVFKYCERFEPRSHFFKYCNGNYLWNEGRGCRLLTMIVDALTSEPTIRSCDTSQQIPCFDSCQLSLVWKSKIKFNAGCHTC